MLASTGDSPVRAAYRAVTGLIARYSGKMTKTVGPTSIEYGSLVNQWRSLLKELAAMGGADGMKKIGPPTAGGLDEPLATDIDWQYQGR